MYHHSRHANSIITTLQWNQYTYDQKLIISRLKKCTWHHKETTILAFDLYQRDIMIDYLIGKRSSQSVTEIEICCNWDKAQILKILLRYRSQHKDNLIIFVPYTLKRTNSRLHSYQMFTQIKDVDSRSNSSYPVQHKHTPHRSKTISYVNSLEKEKNMKHQLCHNINQISNVCNHQRSQQILPIHRMYNLLMEASNI